MLSRNNNRVCIKNVQIFCLKMQFKCIYSFPYAYSMAKQISLKLSLLQSGIKIVVFRRNRQKSFSMQC